MSGLSGLQQMFTSPVSATGGVSELPAAEESHAEQAPYHHEEVIDDDDDDSYAQILRMLRSLDERVGNAEATIKAYEEIQGEVLEKVIDLQKALENLSNQTITQNVLDTSLKPLTKSVEEMKVILNTMKAAPIMSSAPKRTTTSKEKERAQDASPDFKPTEGAPSTQKGSLTAAQMAESIKLRAAERKRLAEKKLGESSGGA